MSWLDFWGLLLSYVYAFGLLLVVEQIGKKARWPNFVTRKIIHIGAGLWTWAILFLFAHWYIGVIPFATFIVLNYVFYRQQTFKAMDGEKESPGTVYFAISITVLFLIGWRHSANDSLYLILPPIMAMTWGDAMASLIGKFQGKHHYTFWGSTKSVEGSVMMFVFSFLAIGLSLLILRNAHLDMHLQMISVAKIWGTGAMVGLLAAIIEAFSPAGTDNLFVPLLSAAALYFLI